MMSLDELVRISSNKMNDDVEEVERKTKVEGGEENESDGWWWLAKDGMRDDLNVAKTKLYIGERERE
jgi:hypothetical protein